MPWPEGALQSFNDFWLRLDELAREFGDFAGLGQLSLTVYGAMDRFMHPAWNDPHRHAQDHARLLLLLGVLSELVDETLRLERVELERRADRWDGRTRAELEETIEKARWSA